MGNDVLSAGFFLMIIGSSYTFFKDLIVGYYHEIQSWFYVSIVVQEGDQLYNWLSGKKRNAVGLISRGVPELMPLGLIFLLV